MQPLQDDDEAVQRSPYQPAAVVQLLPARKVSPNEIGESDWTNALLRDVPRGLADPTNRMVLVNLADDTRYYSFVYKDFFRQLRAGLNAEYEEMLGNGVHRLQYEQSPNVDEQSAHRQGNASSSRSIPVLLRQLPHPAPDEENRALRDVSGHKKHAIQSFWLLNCKYRYNIPSKSLES